MPRKRSSQTTLAGLPAGLIGAIAAVYALVRAVLQGGLIHPDGSLDEQTLGLGLAGVAFLATSVGLWRARDDDKTSEEVGAGGRGRLP